MAGKHRTVQAAEYTAKSLIRLPPALKAFLEDAAVQNNRSYNAEVVERLMYSNNRKPYDHKLWAALRALKPFPGDTRTDREIADQIAAAKGEPVVAAKEPVGLEEVEIDWLPGTEGDLWNDASTKNS